MSRIVDLPDCLPDATDILGSYKLIVGDCVAAMKHIPASSVKLIVADPPYNIWRNKQACRGGKAVAWRPDYELFANFAEYTTFTSRWLAEAKRVLGYGGCIYIFCNYFCMAVIHDELNRNKFYILEDIIWYKPNATPMLVPNKFQMSTELIWLAKRDKHEHHFFDYTMLKSSIGHGKQVRNVWSCPAVPARGILGRKPTALFELMILASSSQGDTILDPFVGSGTSCIAAIKHGRNAIGIDSNRVHIKQARQEVSSYERSNAEGSTSRAD